MRSKERDIDRESCEGPGEEWELSGEADEDDRASSMGGGHG